MGLRLLSGGTALSQGVALCLSLQFLTASAPRLLGARGESLPLGRPAGIPELVWRGCRAWGGPEALRGLLARNRVTLVLRSGQVLEGEIVWIEADRICLKRKTLWGFRDPLEVTQEFSCSEVLTMSVRGKETGSLAKAFGMGVAGVGGALLMWWLIAALAGD